MNWERGRISMFLLGCIGTAIGFGFDGLSGELHYGYSLES